MDDVFGDNAWNAVPNMLDTSALSKVDEMLTLVLDALARSQPLELVLKRRPNTLQDISAQPASPLIIQFPGKSPHEAWKFTVYFRVLDLVHETLVTGRSMTKRDIYYQDPDLFGKQGVVDQCVDTIAYTLDETRSGLNVKAAAKGISAGRFTIIFGNGSTVDGMDPGGILVPVLEAADDLLMESPLEVVVVEKEAVFHSILASPAWPRISQRSILVTGKGYPDLASRIFVHRLVATMRQHPQPPHLSLRVGGLVDFDPDGIHILLTYKYGTAQLAHEGDAARTAVISWVGCRSDDIFGDNEIKYDHGLRQLTHRDHKKAVSMLNWPYMEEGCGDPIWRRELQVMLMLGYKFEIEMVESIDHMLCS